MTRSMYLFALLLIMFHSSNAQTTNDTLVPLPSLRVQAEIQRNWTQERINMILPKLMQKYNVDLWLVAMKEYTEDPVFWSIRDPTQFSARRITIWTFFLDKNNETIVKNEFIGFEFNNVWEKLVDYINETNPNNITLNVDRDWRFSDGLHVGVYQTLLDKLDPWKDKIVHQPQLAIDFLSTRTDDMLHYYTWIMKNVHYIIGQAFTSEFIVPNVTTTTDVEWWFRDQVIALNMTVWFQPNVEIFGREGDITNNTIYQGDLLWCDFGVSAMGLKTDTQHIAYVLKNGEIDVPDHIANGLIESNKLQDIFISQLKPGLTGNEVLENCKNSMNNMSINGTFYSHPIGDWGHGPGPSIGFWDYQNTTLYGNATVLENSWYSCELQATIYSEEWNKYLSFRQEEDVYIDAIGNVNWVDGRQVTLWLVNPQVVIYNTSSWISVGVICGILFLGVIIFVSYQAYHKFHRPYLKRDYDSVPN